MNPTILIIDDDAKLNQLLKDFLKDFGLEVVTATHPAKGLKTLKQASPDLVILDIMLPEMDIGLTVLLGLVGGLGGAGSGPLGQIDDMAGAIDQLVALEWFYDIVPDAHFDDVHHIVFA